MAALLIAWSLLLVNIKWLSVLLFSLRKDRIVSGVVWEHLSVLLFSLRKDGIVSGVVREHLIVCFIIFPQKRWNCFWSYTGTFDCLLFFLRKDGIVFVVVWEHLIVLLFSLRKDGIVSGVVREHLSVLLFSLRKDGIVSGVVWEHLIVCFIIFPQKRWNCFWSYTGTFDCLLFFLRKDGIRWNCFCSCMGTFDCLFYYFPSEKTELFLELYGNIWLSVLLFSLRKDRIVSGVVREHFGAEAECWLRGEDVNRIYQVNVLLFSLKN